MTPESDPTRRMLAQAVAAGAVIAAAVFVAVVMFGGSSGYRVTAYFENAGQLLKGNEVQVGGHVAGRVEDVQLTDSSQVKVTLSVDDDIAPLHEGTRATIRAPSLSGIANRYLSLQPGPDFRAEIPDGGLIGPNSTSGAVDLDQVFDMLNPRARSALQQVIQGSATASAGRADEISESIKYLSPALSATSRVTRELVLDEGVFVRFLVDAASVSHAIAERRSDLTSLVGNANATARAVGDENVALDQALALLPGTLRKANTTFVNLRATLDDLDPLVAEAKPATKDLAPFLRDLRPLVDDALPTVSRLETLIRAPGPDNDLIDLTAQQPRLESLTSEVFPRAIRTLDASQPVVDFGVAYTPELVGWFTKFAESAATYDANGHYARIQPVVSTFALDGVPQLVPRAPGTNRLTGFALHQVKRCPGGGVQPSPDGSTPFVVPDCLPSASVP
jgi:phospholipid/cholesterol/gamma-HCH transport system substrate-binding protein